jgi:DNA-binding MarR family transcriptional regulator
MSEITNLASRLRATIRVLKRQADAVSGPDAPSRSELSVMAWLDEKGEMTPSALSATDRVRPQTMGQTLDSLDRRRWIKRTKHPTDRRQILVSLSPAGLKALAEGRSRRQAWLEAQLGGLTRTERRTLGAGLGVLEQILNHETQPKDQR